MGLHELEEDTKTQQDTAKDTCSHIINDLCRLAPYLLSKTQTISAQYPIFQIDLLIYEAEYYDQLSRRLYEYQVYKFINLIKNAPLKYFTNNR